MIISKIVKAIAAFPGIVLDEIMHTAQRIFLDEKEVMNEPDTEQGLEEENT